MNIIGNAIDELYRYFEALNKEYYNGELPDVVITIQKSRANNLGHFTLGKVWKNKNSEDNDELSKHEININSLNLNRPAVQIVETLQHEMVHYFNKLSDIKDCNGQIHNKKFKEAAEKVGLICEKSKQYGWGFTSLTDGLNDFIVNEIKPNEEAFEYFRTEVIVDRPKKVREKKSFKYTCPSCNLEAKAKRDMKIVCGDCGVVLEMEDED